MDPRLYSGVNLIEEMDKAKAANDEKRLKKLFDAAVDGKMVRATEYGRSLGMVPSDKQIEGATPNLRRSLEKPITPIQGQTPGNRT